MRSTIYSIVCLSLSLTLNVNAAFALAFPVPGEQIIGAGTAQADPLSESGDGSPVATADHYPHIAELEQTILGRTYPGQEPHARLARMEAQAFGKPSSNPDMSARTDALEDFAEQKLHKAPPPPPEADIDTLPAPSRQASNDANSIGMKYPHINSLEQTIFGQTYASDSLQERISRLEIKAFGVVSTDPDFSHRTDALDQYVAQNLSNSSGTQPKYKETVSQTNTLPGAVPMRYPHIESLETTILGDTFPNDTLQDRVSRMEVKAFGSASSNPDMSVRTDALEAYADKKLHKRPQPQNNDEDTASNGQQQQGSSGGMENKILNMVGKTLLGMSPLGSLGGGAMPFMSGMGGMGGGGRGRHQQAQQQAQPAEKPAPPPPDPAITSSNPPPSSAKMITKVAWCEMQVFGHTAPDLHLTQRLEQLNQLLNYAPGQSGDKLMDDLDPLIKAVLAEKHKIAGAKAQSVNQ
jgi:hypothetical protein